MKGRVIILILAFYFFLGAAASAGRNEFKDAYWGMITVGVLLFFDDLRSLHPIDWLATQSEKAYWSIKRIWRKVRYRKKYQEAMKKVKSTENQ